MEHKEKRQPLEQGLSDLILEVLLLQLREPSFPHLLKCLQAIQLRIFTIICVKCLAITHGLGFLLFNKLAGLLSVCVAPLTLDPQQQSLLTLRLAQELPHPL